MQSQKMLPIARTVSSCQMSRLQRSVRRVHDASHGIHRSQERLISMCSTGADNQAVFTRSPSAVSFMMKSSVPGMVKVFEGENNHLKASCDVPAGTQLLREVGEIVDAPTRYTFQVDAVKHLDVQGIIQFANHCCGPNCAVTINVLNGRKGEIILHTLRDVGAGEELTWNYNTNEWDMSDGFGCFCCAPCCVGNVQGFKHLDLAVQKGLRETGTLRPPIMQQWHARAD